MNMITAEIRRQQKHMRTMNFTESGITTFQLDDEIFEPNLAVLPDGPDQVNHPQRAYYLAWRPNSGLFIDIPTVPSASDPYIFLTANLSGCCVGVQNCGARIRLRHYNLDDVDGFTFSQNDLSRYGDNVFWLMPRRTYHGANLERAVFYRHPSNGADAAFWGEYINGKWHFYFQHGNYGTDIVEMIY
jgi:hypothetical protein